MYTLGIDAFSSRQQKTGVEWYKHHLLQAMELQTPEEWGFFLYTLTSPPSMGGVRGGWSPPPLSSPIKGEENYGWQWKQLKWPPKRGWSQIRLSWEMVVRPPDVLFVPAAAIPFIHPHSAVRKRFTATTIHDVGFLEQSDLYSPADRRRQEIALQFALNHAALIFVPSEATKKAIENYTKTYNLQPTTYNLVVTPLGVDHARYRPILSSRAEVEGSLKMVREKYKLNEPYLLYVGRLDAKKNLPTLIRAFAKNYTLHPTPYTLALAGSRGYGAEEIDKAIRESGVEDKIKILGYVPEEDLPALYAGARAFAFPSAYEGFGLPVLQALASGIPTVCSDIPSLREVAGESAIFIEPNNLEGWSDALKKITSDEDLRAKLSREGPERAKQFGWDRCAQLTWQAICNLLQ